MNPYPSSPAHRAAYEAGARAAKDEVSPRHCPYGMEAKAFRRAWFHGRYDWLKGQFELRAAA